MSPEILGAIAGLLLGALILKWNGERVENKKVRELFNTQNDNIVKAHDLAVARKKKEAANAVEEFKKASDKFKSDHPTDPGTDPKPAS